jgi:hypothetical protein
MQPNPPVRIASSLTAALAALLFSAAVSAQVVPRRIPADAPRGSFTAGQLPGVYIDGRLMRLAPGARILMPDNLTTTPNKVPADSPVRYKLDAQGQVQTVWVLSAEEARRR